MIDTNDFYALWSAIRNHPDYRGGVVWNRKDIENAANENEICDIDALDAIVCFDTWEEMSITDGWNYTINQAVSDLKYKNEHGH